MDRHLNFNRDRDYAFADMVDDPADVVLENAFVDTANGTITIVGGAPLVVPSFTMNPTGGVPVRVFVVRTLRVKNATFQGTRAVAFVARSDITIEGRLQLARGLSPSNVPGCTGGTGQIEIGGNGDDPSAVSGSGGGGFATAGGQGGDVVDHVVGGVGGGTSGNPELVPLRGGCWSGGLKIKGAGGSDFIPVTPGGGAVQLVSRTRIDVLSVIDADGETGECEQVTDDGGGCYGGGAGGGILLEAPVVVLGDGGALLARGGGGGGGAFQPQVDSMLPIPGLGGGGDGAAPGFNAQDGDDVTYSVLFATFGSGGGGGMGRIRVNTIDGTFIQSSTSIIAGALTTGTVTTR